MADAPAPPVLSNARDAAALLAGLSNGPLERATVLYLDPEWRLLGRSDFTGTAGTIAPSLRTIIAMALRLDATALVIGHGHPSGCPDPSAADLAYTRTLVQVAAALGIAVVDHLILAGDAIVSLREAGLM